MNSLCEKKHEEYCNETAIDTYQTFESLDEFPRYEKPNKFNYDDLTLARKNKEMRELIRDFPDVSPFYIEMFWDLLENASPEEKEKMKEWKKSKPKPRPKGGEIVGAVTIE